MIIAPRDSVPKGRFVYTCKAWNVARMLTVTLRGQFIAIGKDLRLESGREKVFSKGLRHSLTQEAPPVAGAAKITIEWCNKRLRSLTTNGSTARLLRTRCLGAE